MNEKPGPDEKDDQSAHPVNEEDEESVTEKPLGVDVKQNQPEGEDDPEQETGSNDDDDGGVDDATSPQGSLLASRASPPVCGYTILSRHS